MRSGFRLGRIFGIKLIVDWSWVFIFLLVTWNLSSGFADMHPQWGTALNLGIAVLAGLLFFVSVLVHELAHSLVAIKQGLPVKNITLFLFGGVSNIEKEPPSPRAEFLIAIVGPLTSFVLGGLFLLLSRLLTGGLPGIDSPRSLLAQLDPLVTMLMVLASINIVLAIFNLIPGFPLDGGRVLRSILWAITGNLRKATRWASYAGQLVAWTFIVAGISMVFGVRVPFFGTGLGGLWLAFIGWFLNSAATQSYQQVVIHDILEGVPVSRLTRSNIPPVHPDTSVTSLVHDHIVSTEERAFPVLQDDQLLGLVCIEDVRKVAREAWDSTPVRQIMTPADQLVTAAPHEDLAEVLERLVRRDISQMPVLQAGRYVGLLRRRDIARWLELQGSDQSDQGAPQQLRS